MKLEEFLKININAKFGEEFIFENSIVQTTRQFPLEQDVITVISHVSCLDWFFPITIDLPKLDTHLGEKAGFYFWLKDVFMPKMKNALMKRLKEEPEDNKAVHKEI